MLLILLGTSSTGEEGGGGLKRTKTSLAASRARLGIGVASALACALLDVLSGRKIPPVSKNFPDRPLPIKGGKIKEFWEDIVL